jgi:hypothetical protein
MQAGGSTVVRTLEDVLVDAQRDEDLTRLARLLRQAGIGTVFTWQQAVDFTGISETQLRKLAGYTPWHVVRLQKRTIDRLIRLPHITEELLLDANNGDLAKIPGSTTDTPNVVEALRHVRGISEHDRKVVLKELLDLLRQDDSGDAD